MNRKRMLATGMVILTLALSSSIGAFASSDTASTTKATEQTQEQRQNIKLTEDQRTAMENARKSSMQEAATTLVANGTLTQDEADTLLANLNKTRSNTPSQTRQANGMLKNLTDTQKEALNTEMKSVYEASLAQLVTDGTITQDQADQLKTEQQGQEVKVDLTDTQRKAINDARMNSMKISIANLVANGTLTQTEADTLLADHDKTRNNTPDQTRQANGMFKNLTETQKEALNTEMKSVYESSLAQLVTDGTITQDQADQLIAGQQGQRANEDLTDTQRKAVNDARMNSMKISIANLVANGTLTQTEADEITTPKSNQNSFKAQQKENGMFAGLTDTQIKAFQDASLASFKVALADLVSNGTITQTIADQVQNMPMGHVQEFKHGQNLGI